MGMWGHADMNLNAWQQRQVHGRPCTAQFMSATWPEVQLHVCKTVSRCDTQEICLAPAMQ